MKVLDASAVLAVLRREVKPGTVDLEGGILSSVNLAEVITVLVRNEKPVDTLIAELELLGVVIKPFTASEAERTGKLYKATKPYGLSLGDRACLAVAGLLGATAVTAESAWTRAEHGTEVEVIR